ncbi:COX15-CtaA-domain-containing protein [Polyporus arcularius HHB13444]|uniref:COX15-CtaA-domain-containing protein n=1 Tax=Polyporus arcularius HHB13444 TaxID=1314778 RepID=A0A5C3P361_9APHY|nr:COX15-CtaA-domain-containing protein [Polyporus arcularius HHB13444]
MGDLDAAGTRPTCDATESTADAHRADEIQAKFADRGCRHSPRLSQVAASSTHTSVLTALSSTSTTAPSTRRGQGCSPDCAPEASLSSAARTSRVKACVSPLPPPANPQALLIPFTVPRVGIVLKKPALWSPSRNLAFRAAAPRRAFDPRFFSSNAAEVPANELPVLSPPSVGGWLLGSAVLVFAVIVVGGVTRFTESGLSITEWKPISGILPPLTQAQWNEEFEKYKATPEFELCAESLHVLHEFKEILYMEWGHRVLGRISGIGFVVPLAYFALRKRLTATLPKNLVGMALLIGA